MDNLELLFYQNDRIPRPPHVTITKGRAIYSHKKKVFNIDDCIGIIAFINELEKKYPSVRLPIHISLGQSVFADKLSYVMLECICDHLITNCKRAVSVYFKPQESIHVAGIMSSPLCMLGSASHQRIAQYHEKFCFEIFKYHYRRLLNRESLCTGNSLSVVMDELAYFQKMFNIRDDNIETISETLVELIGNAGEHGHSDCLIDLDIAPNYKKLGSDGNYIGINIAIINIGKYLLGTSLRERILGQNNYGAREAKVKQAYNNHTLFFDETYTEEDFFNIAVFQHKISSRNNNSLTGGTGLTKLIHSLETKSDHHICYVLTGQKQLAFLPQYLRYTDDNWIGFNDENDFFNLKPSQRILSSHSFFLPGTAFNLTFVLKMEVNDGKY